MSGEMRSYPDTWPTSIWRRLTKYPQWSSRPLSKIQSTDANQHFWNIGCVQKLFNIPLSACKHLPEHMFIDMFAGDKTWPARPPIHSRPCRQAEGILKYNHNECLGRHNMVSDLVLVHQWRLRPTKHPYWWMQPHSWMQPQPTNAGVFLVTRYDFLQKLLMAFWRMSWLRSIQCLSYNPVTQQAQLWQPWLCITRPWWQVTTGST